MGNILEKLEYLGETISNLKTDWLYLGKNVTLRQHSEWVKIWLEHFHALNGSNHKPPYHEVTLANGEKKSLRYSITNCIVCPKIYFGSRNLTFPITIGTTQFNNVASTYEHIDFSAYDRIKFNLKYVAVKSLILPKNAVLEKNTIYGGTQNVTFSTGIRIPDNVHSCNSAWISFTLTNNPPVEVYVDNILYSTLYFSRIPLSVESMLRIIDKLYDYSTTSFNATLNLGTTNKAKLTNEQLAIAINKGWTVT